MGAAVRQTVLWRGRPDGVVLISRKGDAAPDIDGTTVDGAGPRAMNAACEVAFFSFIKGQGVTLRA